MKIKNWKINSWQSGMTYVELIVVLSILSIIASISLYNYHGFQGKVDLKNLANDIALKAVEAQKRAIYGNFPPASQIGSITSTWNPAYGLYFNRPADNKSFYRFTDLNNNNIYEGSNCISECLEKISITKGNSISALNIYYVGNSTPQAVNEITMVFTRPSGAAIISTNPPASPNIEYAEIAIVSPTNNTASVKIYSSGRIQIN
jgi:prepilin-type N-terminal cleavage/methylation domain-containing protein